MEKLDHHKIKEAYTKAGTRLFFLDYEGTLAPSGRLDQSAMPIESLNELLFSITSDPNNHVVIFSKRPKEHLDDWFNYLPLTLAAESGGFFRLSKNQWQPLSSNSLAWKEGLYRSLAALTLRYQGTFIERRHYSLTWNYKAVIHETESEKRQFYVALRSLARNKGCIVHDENNIIEFITSGISKGKFAAHWAGGHGRYDFILAIGDDWTDEDLFEAIGSEYFTIKVGDPLNSAARYFLGKQEDVLPFVKNLIRNEKELAAS